MTFRNATLADLESILKIENDSFPPHEAASPATLTKRLQLFPQHFWLLEDNNQLIGFINGMITDNRTLTDDMFTRPELHNDRGAWQSVFGIAVAPEFRRKGYAAKLLNHLIARSKEENRVGVTLTCKEYLVSYYQKFGFVDAGISKSKYAGEVWHDMVLTF